MRVAVVDFPGSNSSAEVAKIVSSLGHDAVVLDYHADSLKDAEMAILPGGFSFGDYLRPGALAKGTPVSGVIRKFATDGGAVLGIGNGFQILCEIGVLPGCLLQNPDMKFCNKEVQVKVVSNECPFTKNLPIDSILTLPMGCYYGRYYLDRRTINDLENTNHIALKYCDQYGDTDIEKPFLGSLRGVAGIINRHGNVLGLMPRIERATDPLQGTTDGLKFFQSFLPPIS